MAVKKNKKKDGRSFLGKLKSKYRLVILNDETFEERASFRLSRFNVYAIVGSLTMVLVIILTSLFAFTPVGEMLLGHDDNFELRGEWESLYLEMDSLRMENKMKDVWLRNVMNVLTDNIDSTAGQMMTGEETLLLDTQALYDIPREDLQLREEIEGEESFSLRLTSENGNEKVTLKRSKFFPPIKGAITGHYDPGIDHFGTDITAPSGTPVKSTLDGTVIVSDWTLETGYVIGIQHNYNLISFYKHNSVLLKKVGNFVKAGDAVAIIGNSGELTDGPHLHFELWLDGVPVDPEEYVMF